MLFALTLDLFVGEWGKDGGNISLPLTNLTNHVFTNHCPIQDMFRVIPLFESISCVASICKPMQANAGQAALPATQPPSHPVLSSMGQCVDCREGAASLIVQSLILAFTTAGVDMGQC